MLDLQRTFERQEQLKALGGRLDTTTGNFYFGDFVVAFVCIAEANTQGWNAAINAIPKNALHRYIVINIKGCSSCGQDHANIRCKAFKGDIAVVNGLPYTHHCICPVDLDPILVFQDDATSLESASMESRGKF